MYRHIAGALILVLAPAIAHAQSAERSTTYEVDATVVSVDAETRQVLLRDDTTGATEVVVAGPEVKNFDQIEKGDIVSAVYSLGIAARMAAPGEVDTIAAVEGTKSEGEKPGALTGTSVTRVLELIEFDPEASVAILRDSEGVQRRIEVITEEGRAFASELAAGDRVALTFSESMVIGIVEK